MAYVLGLEAARVTNTNIYHATFGGSLVDRICSHTPIGAKFIIPYFTRGCITHQRSQCFALRLRHWFHVKREQPRGTVRAHLLGTGSRRS